jgi:hypothetical protein
MRPRHFNPALKPISDEASAAYVMAPYSCPHCQSVELRFDRGVSGHLGEALEFVSCEACGEAWVEVYELVFIEHQS